MIIRFHTLCVFLLVCAQLCMTRAQDTSANCSEESWCKTQSHFCDTVPRMKTICSKTCGTCKPAGCQGCQHTCSVKADNSFVCTCYTGFTLMADGKSCKDINECENNPCGPGETCYNSVGSYNCRSKADLCSAVTNFMAYYENEDACCKKTTFGSCGQNTQNTGRVVQGKDAIVAMWPWMAYILMPGSQLCGGTLINYRWLISSAHCFDEIKNPKNVQIYLGVRNTSDLTASHVKSRYAAKITKHPKYKFPENDIALVKLNKPLVTGSDFIKPVCLPNGEVPPTGTKCYATGFGLTAEGGTVSRLLKEVDLPIVENKLCVDAFKNEIHTVNDRNMICAGYTDGTKDACQGDSGGPLVCQRCDSCDWYVTGLTSFGKGCATPGYYGVYTKVEHFEKWIDDSIKTITVQKKICRRTKWGEWGGWSPCPVTCGGGSQTRLRICMNAQHKKDPRCRGNDFETIRCNEQSCPQDSWTDWSICSVTCGKGTQERRLVCVTKSCKPKKESKSCNAGPCHVWSKWGDWSSCDATCGSSFRTRTRSCVGAKKSDVCKGPSSEQEKCNKKTCSVWGLWPAWPPCPVSCGGAQQTGTRECLGGTDCKGSKTRTRICNPKVCPGIWSKWSDWGDCSAECGGGQRARTRTCDGGAAGGPGCPGLGEETEVCNSKQCPKWSNWSDWTACSVTCGGGTRTRNRTCMNEANSKSGCTGEKSETESCSVDVCPEPVCSEQCSTGIRQGFCITHKSWMNDFCEPECCGSFCKDTWKNCDAYGYEYCANAAFVAVCLKKCRLCPVVVS